MLLWQDSPAGFSRGSPWLCERFSGFVRFCARGLACLSSTCWAPAFCFLAREPNFFVGQPPFFIFSRRQNFALNAANFVDVAANIAVGGAYLPCYGMSPLPWSGVAAVGRLLGGFAGLVELPQVALDRLGRYSEELGQLVLRVAMSERCSISGWLWSLGLCPGCYSLARRVAVSGGSQTLWWATGVCPSRCWGHCSVEMILMIGCTDGTASVAAAAHSASLGSRLGLWSKSSTTVISRVSPSCAKLAARGPVMATRQGRGGASSDRPCR